MDDPKRILIFIKIHRAKRKMDFVTVEQLAASTGASTKTLRRKIEKLEKDRPELFAKLAQKRGRPWPTLYAIKILDYLKVKPLTPKSAIKILAKVAQDKKNPTKLPGYVHLSDRPEKEEMQIFSTILTDFQTGLYGLQECIDRSESGITITEFWQWINNRPHYSDLYDAAYETHKKAYNYNIQERARASLSKLINGYSQVLESVSYVEKISPTGETIMIPVERRKQEKYIPANVHAVMFALTNRDPKEWKRVLYDSAPGDRPEIDPLESKSNEELLAIIKNAESKGLLKTNT